MAYQILRVVRDWLAVEKEERKDRKKREAIREAKMALVKLMKFL